MTDVSQIGTWNRSGLMAAGFDGFTPLRKLDPGDVPLGRGVYVVLRPIDIAIRFLAESHGRALRSYDLDELSARWIPAVETIYIGKAGGKRGLRGRLSPFARMAPNHSGGRSIWQLSEPDTLVVCWLETPLQSAEEIEDSLHAQFFASHGALPFANVGLSRAARRMVMELLRDT